MSTTSIACRELVEMVTDYLEDTLTPAQRAAVRAHLTACPHCAEYLKQMRQLIALSAHLLHPQPDVGALPAGMLDDLLEAFRRQRAQT